MKNLCSRTQCGGFQFLLILVLWGVSFHAVVVFGLGKNLLFKSVLGHCDWHVLLYWSPVVSLKSSFWDSNKFVFSCIQGKSSLTSRISRNLSLTLYRLTSKRLHGTLKIKLDCLCQHTHAHVLISQNKLFRINALY